MCICLFVCFIIGCCSLDLDSYSKESLWQLVVETAHSSVMFVSHKAYTKGCVLLETPDVTPQELAHRLNMSLGEALVILDELSVEAKES